MVLQQVQKGQLVPVPNMPSPLNAQNFGTVVGDTVSYFLTTITPICDSCTLPWMTGQPTNLLSVPIYCTVVQKAPWLYDFVYYTFYPYNAGKIVDFWVFGASSFGNHVGDWEHITVRLNLLTPNNPIATYYASRHAAGLWYYDSNSPGCLLNYNDQIQLSGTHPIFYAAAGSHAFYPVAGNTKYQDVPPLTDNHNGQNPNVWYTWNNVAVRFANDPADGDWSWWNYAGRWGNPQGTGHITYPDPSLSDPFQTDTQYVLESGPSSPNSNIGAFYSNDYGATMQ